MARKTAQQNQNEEILAAVVKAEEKSLTAIATEWAAIAKRTTALRRRIGDWARTAMTRLADASYPETDRPAAIIAMLRTKGVDGFSFDTVKSWGAANDAFHSIGKDKAANLPLYTLIDLGRIPADPEHKTGGRVAVADAMLAAFPDGKDTDGKPATDDQYRKFVREYRDTKMGKTKPEAPSVVDQAAAIAKAASYPVPSLVPNPDGTFTVSHDDLVEVAVFGYAWRDTGGGGERRTQGAYRLAFQTAIGHPLAAVADGDQNGTNDGEPTDAQLAAIDEAVQARKAAEAALAATDASL